MIVLGKFSMIFVFKQWFKSSLRNLYVNVDSSIHNHPKLEPTQCTSAGDWISKLVRPYDGTFLSNRKERTIDTYNMDESQRHSAEWRNPVSKVPTVGFYFYESRQKAKQWGRSRDQWFPGLRVGEGLGPEGGCGWWSCPGFCVWWWLRVLNCTHVLKLIKVHTHKKAPFTAF